MGDQAARYVAPSDLRGWEEHPNPRENADAVAAVVASIRRFGFGAPIVALEDGRIIAGETRWKAARELVELGELERVPVRFVELEEAEARAYRLADNRLGELSSWHPDLLANEIRELTEEGLDLTVAGFDEAELDALLGDGGIEGSVDPEALPSPPIAGSATRHAPRLVNGEALATLRAMPDSSVDAVITDPPYGLGFMASATKGWDAPDMAWASEWAVECLRVLKPGGHLLAWSSDRTDHHIKVALEDAGFEIRRTFCWATFQGFPKSVAADLAIDKHLGALDRRPVVGRADDSGKSSIGTGRATYEGGGDGETGHDVTGPATDEAARFYGYGTDVKPANEPAVLARKPLEGTLAENLLKWGTGALHIDAARHAPGDPMWLGPQGEVADPTAWAPRTGGGHAFGGGLSPNRAAPSTLGRFPSSLVFCPKVGRRERNWGCEGLPPRRPPGKEGRADGAPGTIHARTGAGGQREGDRNFHPTLKPIALCRWFVRLLAPGPGSVILDTFAGSGSLVVASIVEGHKAIGIEREGDEANEATGSAGLGYFAILEARAAAALEIDLDTLAAIGDH